MKDIHACKNCQHYHYESVTPGLEYLLNRIGSGVFEDKCYATSKLVKKTGFHPINGLWERKDRVDIKNAFERNYRGKCKFFTQKEINNSEE